MQIPPWEKSVECCALHSSMSMQTCVPFAVNPGLQRQLLLSSGPSGSELGQHSWQLMPSELYAFRPWTRQESHRLLSAEVSVPGAHCRHKSPMLYSPSAHEMHSVLSELGILPAVQSLQTAPFILILPTRALLSVPFSTRSLCCRDRCVQATHPAAPEGKVG